MRCMNRFDVDVSGVLMALGLMVWTGCVGESRVDPILATAKPIQGVTATPLPYDRVGFAVHEKPLTVLHHGPLVRRPYLFPIVGPSGRLLTRMGHPRDPYSHSHHNSVWISHHAVDGVDFWSDHGKNTGRILTDRVQRLDDGDDEASALIWNRWVDAQDRTLLIERRRVAVRPLEDQQWMLFIDVQLEVPPGKDRTVIEANPFGLIGVRMAKSIGILDGGGTIRNSEGQVDEKGDQGCFRKPARWCIIQARWRRV